MMESIAEWSKPWDLLGARLKPHLPDWLMNESFDWEKDAVAVLYQYANIWFAVGFLYLPLIFGLKSISQATKPFKPLIKLLWGVWNLGLTAFSFIGACFTAQAFFVMLANFSGTCETPTPALSGITAQWTFYFIVSKMAELGDSVFLALLDKPIAFLHWYHHITIFTFMFFSGLSWHPHLISGVFWNYNVHSVMYLYYGGSSFGISWPNVCAMLITSFQVMQMFMQIGLTVSSVYICGANNVGHYAALVMYGVYFVLFMNFFFGRYGKKASGGAGGKRKVE